jgi:hypothetical protein
MLLPRPEALASLFVEVPSRDHPFAEFRDNVNVT